MNTLRPRNLKQDAANALAAASYNPRRLVLIHTGVVTVFSLALYLVNLWLSQEIGQTGGLGGIGTRTILETAQSILSIANLLLLPFWEFGFLWSAICIARRQDAGPHTLFAGFRRFLPLLGSKLLQGCLLAGVLLTGCYAGVLLFNLTPLSAGLQTALEPYLSETAIDYATIYADEAVRSGMLHALPFMLVGAAAFALPMYYWLRIMDYLVLDIRTGPFRAVWVSVALMRKKRRKLLLLDLSFWWYYLLEGLILAVCYGDLILPLLGVELGMSAEMAAFVFYLIAMVLQLGLYIWKKPHFTATYARFYDEILPKEEETKNPLV